MNILHKLISCDSSTQSRSKNASVALKLSVCLLLQDVCLPMELSMCMLLKHMSLPLELYKRTFILSVLRRAADKLLHSACNFFFYYKVNSNCSNGLIISTYCCPYFHQNSSITGVIVHWIWQIRGALDDQDQPTSADILCPIDEYEFWKYRCKLMK